MIAKWRRRLDVLLAGLLGPPCRLCGERVFAADMREHTDTNHAGDELA